jgi:dolichyl-phosphate-mannose-protein mannosyltransferase
MNLLRNALFRWQTVCLLAAALFVRLVLSPFPGFYGDTNTMVQYSRVITQKGLFAVRDMSMSELYPAGYLYQSWAVGHVLKRKLRNADEFATTGMTPEGATVGERIGARVFPIAYDLMIGVVLLLVLSQYVSFQAGLWGAAIYLFNPGTVVNSALWNYDSMASFYLLVVVFLVGAALRSGKDLFWILAWCVAGLGLCSKLQAGMALPLLGLLTLVSGRVRLLILGPAVLLGTVAVMFAPFLIGHQWLYLKRVFVSSFQSYPVTVEGAYNLWGMWYQRPVSNHFLGLTLESIGRGLFLASFLWLAWQIWRQKIASSGGSDGLRRAAIVSVYAFSAPFILLTRMHERYLAPALAVGILAGFLDPRLRGYMWGLSTCYAVNLLAVLSQSFGPPQGTPTQTHAMHLSYCVIRLFCCLFYVGLFLWLTYQLPKLLRPVESRSAVESASLPRAKSILAGVA